MAIVKSQIDITAKDSTAAAFASVNSGLTGLSSTALKVSGALSAIGATAAIGSFAAFTKQTIDAQDELFKLSQKTGIAVESLAGLEFAAEQSGVELEKVAKATRTFSLLVAESADASSSAAKKLSQLGLSYKDLKDLSPEKQLLALSEALSKFSKQDQAVALTSALGNKMADLIPLLAGGSKNLSDLIEQGKKFNPVTEQSAKQAERFNDQLNVLTKSISSIGRGLVQEMIPGLSAVADRMAKVTQESGFLKGALAGVKELFVQSFGNPKILGDVGQIRREIFKTQEVIANLSVKKDSVFFDANALQHEKDKLAQLEIDLQKAIVTSRGVVEAQSANTESTKKFAIALEETAPKLGKQVSAQDALQKAQSKSLAVESEYIKLLNIERQAREALIVPYQQEAASAEDRLARMRLEAQALDLSRAKQISLEQAIELTTIARLEEKRAASKNVDVVRELDREIAARRQIVNTLRDTESRTKNLTRTTANATDEITQFWIQANRNIQTTFANGIFDLFNDGLDGMVRNVKTAVLRIISEFAALKALEFLGGGGVGTTSTAGGTVSTIASLASMFGGARTGGISTGGGVTTGAFSNAGGAGTAFIGGQGTALGGSGMGVTATRGTGLGGGNLMALGAMAGPYGLAAAAAVMALQALEKKVGDYKLEGGAKFALGAYETFSPMAYVVKGLGLQTPEALIGKFLFGRGPYKFRQQSLQGDISSEGLDGTLTDVFKSKGGVFKKNKHKEFEVDAPSEIIRDVDKTISSIYKSTNEFAKNLGLDASQIDKFTKEIQVKSEKGKALTTEAVSEMLTSFADDITKVVMPSIESFALTGESASKTFNRLNTELETLKSSVQNLGLSVADSAAIIGGLSIDERSSLVDQAGGLDKLTEDTSAFFTNFLSEADRLAIRTSQLGERLNALGVAENISIAEYKKLIESSSTSAETRFGLLDRATQELFLGVRGATELTKQQQVSIKLSINAELEKQKQQEKYNSMLEMANGTISAIGAGIQKLLALAGIIKDAQNDIAPQSVEDARASLIGGLNFDRRGNVRGVKGPQYIDPGAIATLSGMSTSGFGDRLGFLRSQGKNLEVLQLLSIAVSKSIKGEQDALRAVNSERNKIPSFDIGGIVPKTSIAMVHKGERIINPQQNEALVDLLQQLLTATKSGANYSQSVYNLLKNMTNDGLALNTVAA